MDKTFTDLLQELKDSFSQKKLREVISYFMDGMPAEELELFTRNQESVELINNQEELFYDEMAVLFTDDLNDSSLMYFLAWESIIEILNPVKKEYFLNSCVNLSGNTPANYFIKGFQALENGDIELAQCHFNQIDDFSASYFKALCYFWLGNYENSIKQNQCFLNSLNNHIENTLIDTGVDFSKEIGFELARWNVNIDLAYAYNRLKNFREAIKKYENSLALFNLEETHTIMGNINFEENGIDLFTIYINNYIYALRHVGDYKECLELIDFAISKKPASYYLRLKKEIEKLKNKKPSSIEAAELINTSIKTEISKYQQTKMISMEKSLEDLIIEQMKHGFKVFGKNLSLYEDDTIFGRQYYIKNCNGFLDLLLIDKTNDHLFIVELKRNNSGIEVVEQITKYISGLSKEMGKNIKGIICMHEVDEDLIAETKKHNDIELFTYNFDFTHLN